MSGGRRITQEAFDELLAENVVEFGMEPGEALEEAIAALRLQGVDLSSIRTTVPGEGGRQVLRAVQALRAVAGALDAGEKEALCAALAALASELGGPSVQPGAVEAAGREGAVALLLRLLRETAGDQLVLLQGLATLKALLCELHTKDAFTAQGGAEVLVKGILLAHAESAPCVAAAARAAAAAASRHEDTKVALFKAGIAAPLLASLEAHGGDARLAASVCQALSALATADDRRTAASAAFAHGRQLHALTAHVPLMAALQRHPGAASVAGAACCALRASAVNDEACEDIAEAGAVEAAVALLLFELREGSATGVTRSALALLRQLAGADAVKARFLSGGGLPPLVAVLSSCAGPSAVPTCEAALALLSALSLRHPEFVAAAAAAGALDATLDAMAAYASAPGLQRAACMFLRNCAARNPEVRPLLRDRGAEPLLRAAKQAHPSLCTDVGSAALRDLGSENYNEGWTPTTVYMGSEGQLFTYADLGSDGEEDHKLAPLAEE